MILAPASETDDVDQTQPTVFLKAVFHAHTNASADCTMSSEVVVQRCLDEGVDVLAVTDHNEISGALELRRRAPFQVVVGEEIRCEEGGEIIGLFLTKKIAGGLPARAVIAEIRSQGGLVYLPHPFDPLRTKQWKPGLVDTLLPESDIIEVFNARNVVSASNARTAEKARVFQKVPCAGADAHVPAEIGRTVVFLPPFETPAELLRSLRSAHFECVRNPWWVHGATQWTKLWR